MEGRTSLAEKAYDMIKADIVSCRLRPGQLVIEADLAERYGMSKTPVRAALNLLSREKLVSVLPRKGTLIASISVQDIQHTYFLRQLLEPEAAALAARHATPDQIEDLVRLAGSTDTGDEHTAALRHNRQFHVAVAEASANPRLAAMVSELLTEVERFYNSHAAYHDSDHLRSDRHQELVEAIRAGDAERARSVTIENIRRSRKHLIAALVGESDEAIDGRAAHA
ncbi:GntR family transcriptional regulator [Actinomadura verrucosospora]|uniref:GntR family transcriptional regulator n=1 Tax=Actinomadura verrucosospora TaxID=46165 RepID=A0A7D3ZJQ0_ACTVE|nr:GntR family transcriptional regulator [Actinomadura verrucosospora]QKG21561.1 GntR family transcriptional regulator [Actinomadura verrucosospora]